MEGIDFTEGHFEDNLGWHPSYRAVAAEYGLAAVRYGLPLVESLGSSLIVNSLYNSMPLRGSKRARVTPDDYAAAGGGRSSGGVGSRFDVCTVATDLFPASQNNTMTSVNLVQRKDVRKLGRGHGLRGRPIRKDNWFWSKLFPNYEVRLASLQRIQTTTDIQCFDAHYHAWRVTPMGHMFGRGTARWPANWSTVSEGTMLGRLYAASFGASGVRTALAGTAPSDSVAAALNIPTNFGIPAETGNTTADANFNLLKGDVGFDFFNPSSRKVEVEFYIVGLKSKLSTDSTTGSDGTLVTPGPAFNFDPIQHWGSCVSQEKQNYTNLTENVNGTSWYDLDNSYMDSPMEMPLGPVTVSTEPPTGENPMIDNADSINNASNAYGQFQTPVSFADTIGDNASDQRTYSFGSKRMQDTKTWRKDMFIAKSFKFTLGAGGRRLCDFSLQRQRVFLRDIANYYIPSLDYAFICFTRGEAGGIYTSANVARPAMGRCQYSVMVTKHFRFKAGYSPPPRPKNVMHQLFDCGSRTSTKFDKATASDTVQTYDPVTGALETGDSVSETRYVTLAGSLSTIPVSVQNTNGIPITTNTPLDVVIEDINLVSLPVSVSNTNVAVNLNQVSEQNISAAGVLNGYVPVSLHAVSNIPVNDAHVPVNIEKVNNSAIGNQVPVTII